LVDGDKIQGFASRESRESRLDRLQAAPGLEALRNETMRPGRRHTCVLNKSEPQM
jgi:hypothetical protein